MSSSLNKLTSASEDRKARLAQLRNLKRKQPTDEVATPESTHEPTEHAEDEKIDIAKIHLSGRNYDAETKGPKLGFDAPPVLDGDKQTLEEQAADIEASVKQQAAEEAKDDKGIDLFKLQPKKPNWDLKRNLDAKLEILNVRTDNAIARLVTERIAAEQADKTSAGRKDASSGDREANIDGAAFVEGLRVREKEEEEEEKRERQEADEE